MKSYFREALASGKSFAFRLPKIKVLLVLTVLSSNVFASEQPKHLISFTTGGFGWSGSVERMNTEKKSAFDDLTNITNNVAFNYAYRISKQQHIGFHFQTMHSELKFDKRSGGETRSEKELTSIGIFGLHNFQEEINKSFYVGLGVTYTNAEEEISHDFSDAEGKAPIETDDVIMSYDLIIGKRFTLEAYNIQNLVYSPQVGIFYRSHSKDFDDQGIKNGYGATLLPIKFDLLF